MKNKGIPNIAIKPEDWAAVRKKEEEASKIRYKNEILAAQQSMADSRARNAQHRTLVSTVDAAVDAAFNDSFNENTQTLDTGKFARHIKDFTPTQIISTLKKVADSCGKDAAVAVRKAITEGAQENKEVAHSYLSNSSRQTKAENNMNSLEFEKKLILDRYQVKVNEAFKTYSNSNEPDAVKLATLKQAIEECNPTHKNMATLSKGISPTAPKIFQEMKEGANKKLESIVKNHEKKSEITPPANNG